MCVNDCLTVVFDAMIFLELLYVFPSWIFQNIFVEHLEMIQKVLTKAYKKGLI